MVLLFLWWILIELGNAGVHLIPRLRIGNKEIHLRPEPIRIIKAASGDADRATRALLKFTAGDARATLGAKAALVSATGEAWRDVIFQLALGQAKGRRRHQHAGQERPTRHLLAITAVALEHHEWCS